MRLSALNAHAELLPAEQTLPHNAHPVSITGTHFVHGRSMLPPFPEGLSTIRLGMGCFWGAERLFWQLPGVFSTAVGYAGGHTANPGYEQVCSGRTNHAEVVLVVFDPLELPLKNLLKVFWENHDPTQGMRQGNDRGTQYRSCIYTDTTLATEEAGASLQAYQDALAQSGQGSITTEMRQEPVFFYAEEYHQQYLAKNPQGYCGLRGTGVACPL